MKGGADYRSKTQGWYNTKHWRARRDYQLSIEPLCRLCKDMGLLTTASVADHIIPHRGREDLFEGELQSLCAACHSSVKQSQERTGRLRGAAIDGRPLDPNHHWNR